MTKVFIYWDTSKFSSAPKRRRRNGRASRCARGYAFTSATCWRWHGPTGRLQHAVAVGSIPPEMRQVWNRLENEGVTVELLERGRVQGGEQGVDQLLQTQMLRDTVDYNGAPGIAVLLTGDGVGFHADLERMHRKGWRIEVLSWRHGCNRRMREWSENVGRFIALDDYYESITFLEDPLPGRPVADPRYAVPLDLKCDPR